MRVTQSPPEVLSFEKPLSFFYHFNRPAMQSAADGRVRMTVHVKSRCLIAVHVVCNVPCRTKQNKTQPMLVMTGKTTRVTVDGDTITID